MRRDPGSPRSETIPLPLQAVLGAFVCASTFTIAGTQTALGLAIVLWLLYALKGKAGAPRRTTLELPLLLFILATVAAALVSDERLRSLGGLKNYALISVMYVIGSLLTTRRLASRLLVVLLVSSALSAAYGIATFFLGMGEGRLGRSVGSFSNSMTLGGVLLFLCSLSCAVAIGARIGRRLRLAAAGTALVSAGALFYSFTRSSWIGMFVSAAVMLALLRRRWLAPFAAAAVLFVILLPAPYRAQVTSIWDPKYPTNVHRLDLIRSGVGIVRDHPVMGVGTHDLAEVNRRYLPPGGTPAFGHMHNIFLQVAVQMGFVGLAAFCWLLFSFYRFLARCWRLDLPPPERAWIAGSLGALSGFIANGLFEWNFGDAEVVTLLYLAIGASAAVSRFGPPAAADPGAESAFASAPRIG